jgi:hypothetical protein
MFSSPRPFIGRRQRYYYFFVCNTAPVVLTTSTQLIHFLPSGMRFTPKIPGAPARFQADLFPNRLEVIHKNVSGWFYK